MSVETIESQVRDNLMKFAGLGYRVKFVFDDGPAFLLDGTVTPPTLSAEDGEADCTLRLSAENMEKLMAGTLNPTLAYSLGKLKVDGSIGVALKLASMMEE